MIESSVWYWANAGQHWPGIGPASTVWTNPFCLQCSWSPRNSNISWQQVWMWLYILSSLNTVFMNYNTLTISPEVVVFVVVRDIAPRVAVVIPGCAPCVRLSSVWEGEGAHWGLSGCATIGGYPAVAVSRHHCRGSRRSVSSTDELWNWIPFKVTSSSFISARLLQDVEYSSTPHRNVPGWYLSSCP